MTTILIETRLEHVLDVLNKPFTNENLKGIEWKLVKIKNHSTQDSRMVPHCGTNWAALWLTAQIRRDAVLSESYGRGWKIVFWMAYIPYISSH